MTKNVQVYLVISGTIFGAVSLLHLIRAVSEWPFIIGSMDIPVAASWVGFLATAALCGWALRLTTRT